MQFDLLTFGLRDFICSHIKACREREMHLQLCFCPCWNYHGGGWKESYWNWQLHKWTFASRLFTLFLKQSFIFKNKILWLHLTYHTKFLAAEKNKIAVLWGRYSTVEQKRGCNWVHHLNNTLLTTSTFASISRQSLKSGVAFRSLN